MKNLVPLAVALLVVIPGGQLRVHGAAPMAPKPRVVLTHDPELDDVNTLIRAMLYSSDFKIEGLIYSSAMFHFKGDHKGTTQFIAGREYDRMGRGPVTSWRWPEDDHFIDEIVEAYSQVYANLKVHNPD